MAEPFKSTPASRVFGMGLPRRSNIPPATFFDTPIYEERRNLNPFVRQNAMAEQEIAMQEDALAAQQAQLARQQRIMEAEDAAISGLEQGEEIGNIFKNNPSLALSRNFNQFSNMAEMVRPSKAAQSMIPSLAMKLPIEERGVFNELVNQPEFANNPFAAYDEAQRRGSRSKQHGELVKAGVPLAKIDQTKDYSPIEFEDLVRQHKKPETGSDFTDKLVQQAWSGFDENYMPPEGIDDPVEIAIDMADKKNAIRQRIMEKYGAAPAIPGAATATNITSTAAMGGGVTPTATPSGSPPEAQVSLNIDNVPFADIDNVIEEQKAQPKIAEAWNKAQMDLESKLSDIYKGNYPGTNYSRLRRLAKAIISDEKVPFTPEEGGEEFSTMIPAWADALRKAGLSGEAFKEPENARFGTQKVNYPELIKVWAKNYLDRSDVTAQPQLPPISQEAAQTKSKLLKSVGLNGNG